MHGDIPLKLSQLLAARPGLLQGAQMANLAFAHRTLSEIATRVHRARLTGLVRLQSPEAIDGGCWATLTALEGNQSLIEEHFTDEDLMDLADIIGYVTNADAVSLTFRIEQFAGMFVDPLRAAIEDAGIEVDVNMPALEENPASDFPRNP